MMFSREQTETLQEIAAHETSLKKAREIFEKDLPGSSFREIREEVVPEGVRDIMVGRYLVPLGEQGEDVTRLEHLYALEYPGGDITYVALVEAVYGHKAFLVDARGQDVMGHGRVALIEKEKERTGRALVEMTETFDEGHSPSGKDFKRQGLAIRRLKTMNGISQGFYGLPLSSEGIFISTGEGARRAWEHLASEGRAESKDGGNGRTIYSFMPIETKK